MGLGPRLGIIPGPSGIRQKDHTKERIDMTKAMRWRIIVLQVVALLLLVGGSFGAFYGSTFATDQIKTQLQQEQIFFPKDQASGLLPGLEQYAGQQVLNG